MRLFSTLFLGALLSFSLGACDSDDAGNGAGNGGSENGAGNGGSENGAGNGDNGLVLGPESYCAAVEKELGTCYPGESLSAEDKAECIDDTAEILALMDPVVAQGFFSCLVEGVCGDMHADACLFVGLGFNLDACEEVDESEEAACVDAEFARVASQRPEGHQTFFQACFDKLEACGGNAGFSDDVCLSSLALKAELVGQLSSCLDHACGDEIGDCFDAQID